MIIPVYQRLGTSTHLLAQKVGELHQTKSTHTGTLDPMAEGVAVVLTGEDRFKKEAFASWKKTYEFKIIWGVGTDTHDLLGLATNGLDPQKNFTNLDVKIAQILPDFLGAQTQLIPAFSAKRVDGQSYFDVAKEKSNQKSGENNLTESQADNQTIKLNHTQEITIYSLIQLENREIKAHEIRIQLSKALPQINNDFRQEDVKKKWLEWFQSLPQQENTILPSTTFQATTSKRTYIRGLVRDLSEKLGIPATTFHINRTSNGPYQIQDCICLV